MLDFLRHHFPADGADFVESCDMTLTWLTHYFSCGFVNFSTTIIFKTKSHKKVTRKSNIVFV